MKRLTQTLKQFCENQELLRLAYVGTNGTPHAVPVWYVIVGREHYIGTGAESAKWKAIKLEPRVGWVIDGGKKGRYKGVSMFGKAEEVGDRKLRAKIYRAFGEKYFGSADHPKHIEIWGEIDEPGSVYIRLKPEDGFWWEY
ncbi:MAG TPA: pyridoxamine 5'-phosphate oxidase family protein [Blastocatellia bacterium]|nr:pyridoxamine 5'-phosphate oxidase family protein [Blastocatellia bacterium]